ncbi:sugar ABC transporter permease [Paenibacillus sp. BC26]|uniref:ABC transporter permease n=1 Tax=Paenibacillus sp. BC26 TaxID=1881032 RepID=UPI0008E530EF|nr:ABC transporter permease subunit [Paenibacillus sp. BC26]SFT06796.1 multiple sugar transport system permease protein/putative aldouronate transport system permease protein [Paenibacillus sp. BC26]
MKTEVRVSYAASLRKKILSDRTKLFMLGLPIILLVLIFQYIPLAGWVLAFFDYKPGIPLAKTPFVGLKFFELITTSGNDLLNALKNTLAFYFLNLLTSPLPVIFAILLSEVKHTSFQRVVQTIITLPHFVSWVIVFSLAFSVFSNDGLLNELLMNLHLIKEPTNLLGNGDAVWIFQTMLGIWKSLGWGTIIYLAAIIGIDQELYDAAHVDGAGRFRRIWHITVPGVAPTFIVLMILGMSNLLSVGMEQYLVFYNGLVADKITVLDLYLYRTGILNADYSYSTALGMSKTFISIILLFAANGIAKRIRGYGIV